jgi:predicted PhzF superfamily epimerase YddE/YHI9
MSALGNNVKISVPETSRPQVRALCEALGLPVDSSKPAFDVATTRTGGHIGFAYVPDAEALTPAQMKASVWLELAVRDVDAKAAQLDRVGLARLDFTDKDHPYFIGPGGVVFRLAEAPT